MVPESSSFSVRIDRNESSVDSIAPGATSEPHVQQTVSPLRRAGRSITLLASLIDEFV